MTGKGDVRTKANRKPTKTEYAGCVLDSKSEAIFARCLDLVRIEWIYHPGVHCGHEWDFAIFPDAKRTVLRYFVACGKLLSAECARQPHGPKPMLIEFKPSAPTMTFVQEKLIKPMRENPVESILVFGSPFPDSNPSYNSDCCYDVFPIFCSYAQYGWGNYDPEYDGDSSTPIALHYRISEMFEIDDDVTSEAMEYRFDLQQDTHTYRVRTNTEEEVVWDDLSVEEKGAWS